MSILNELSAIERLALEIVIEAPARRSANCPTTYVSRDMVDELEKHFLALGFNIAAGRARHREIQEEHREKVREFYRSKERGGA